MHALDAQQSPRAVRAEIAPMPKERPMPQAPSIRPYAFVLAVPDLARNTAYFKEALGFKVEWPEGTGWQLVSRGTVRILLGHCPAATPPSATGDHSYFGYLHVDDVDALHAEFVQRGALILQPPADQPHGMREFLVATPDGHRLMMGQDLAVKMGCQPATDPQEDAMDIMIRNETAADVGAIDAVTTAAFLTAPQPSIPSSSSSRRCARRGN